VRDLAEHVPGALLAVRTAGTLTGRQIRDAAGSPCVILLHEVDRRRVIVEVLWGPLASRKAIVEPGGTLCVGRSNLADLALPHDQRMSAKHLAITWDGERCRVRDLGSLLGTTLGGERVGEAEVESGACVRAGGTTLRISFEAPAPAELSEDKAAVVLVSGARRLAGIAVLAAACGTSSPPPRQATPVAPAAPPPASAGASAAASPAFEDAGASAAPKTDPEADVIPASALVGPFAKLDDYCKQDHGYGPAGKGRCLFGGPYGRQIARSEGAIREARLFFVHYADWAGTPASFCRIAVRAAAGWFVDDPGPEAESPCEGPSGQLSCRHGKDCNSSVHAASERLAWSDDGTAVLAVTRHDAPDSGRGIALTVCGVGPSNVPSCSRGLAVGCLSYQSSRMDGNADPVAVRWSYARGAVRIEGDTCGSYDPEGTRRVAFP
jgi:hypothetical protein